MPSGSPPWPSASASLDPEENRAIYTPQQPYPDLAATVRVLHDVGFTVRLICVMLKGMVDGPERVAELVASPAPSG
jgi:hypothetical protein